jgi:hypothetical protein
METKSWSKLSIPVKNKLIAGVTGVEEGLQRIGTLNIQRELSAATDLPSMVEAANRLSATDNIDIRATVDEETGKVTITGYNNDVTSDDYQKPRAGAKTFDNEAEAMRYIAEVTKDPLLGTDNYLAREATAAKLVREAQQQGFENVKDLVTLRNDITETLLGDLSSIDTLDDADLLALDKAVVNIMRPVIASLGIPEESVGGLPNATSDMTTPTKRSSAPAAPAAPIVSPYQGQIRAAEDTAAGIQRGLVGVEEILGQTGY